MLNPKPSSIILSEKSEEPLVTIHMATGEITYGKDYSPDAAAKVFWEAIGPKNPYILGMKKEWSEAVKEAVWAKVEAANCRTELLSLKAKIAKAFLRGYKLDS